MTDDQTTTALQAYALMRATVDVVFEEEATLLARNAKPRETVRFALHSMLQRLHSIALSC